ncbi:MAG: TRAP transporter large permease subunit, partial [Arcobacteraceae bacterium]
MIGVYMFFTALIMLLAGFPVAFTFGGVALVFGIYSEGFSDGMPDGFIEALTQGIGLFDMMPFRIYSIMGNTILMAIPLFIFMGIILQKTKLAEQLLESMGTLFGS